MQAAGMKSVGFGAESSSVTCQNQCQFPRVSRSPGPTQQDCAQNRDNAEQMPLTESCRTAAYAAASSKVTTLGGNRAGAALPDGAFPLPYPLTFPLCSVSHRLTAAQSKVPDHREMHREPMELSGRGSHLPVLHGHQNTRCEAKRVSAQ